MLLFVGISALASCRRGATEQAGSESTQTTPSATTPIPPKPVPPPPEADLDPERLPWHLDEEARAAREIDRANYRTVLDQLERELDAGRSDAR